jgi:hypothetical protein
MRNIKVVSPYRPFAWESPSHRKLGAFDWVGALEMMRESVRISCGCKTFAITDVDTDLPGPTHQYVTTHRRLMIWILEVCLRYLESDDFDRDTVMVSPDMLVFRDLRPWFLADLGVLFRSGEKYAHRPMLNGVQFWKHKAKDRLVAFYRKALAIAPTLPEDAQRWGADTEPIIQLLAPMELGLLSRHGLTVQCLEATHVMRSLNIGEMQEGHRPIWPVHTVVDFKFWRRKQYMRAYYEATLGSAVAQ